MKFLGSVAMAMSAIVVCGTSQQYHTFVESMAGYVRDTATAGSWASYFDEVYLFHFDFLLW